MGATIRSLIFFAAFFSFTCKNLLSANELPGMGNWPESSPDHIKAPFNPEAASFYDLPEWMPSYLYRNLDIPKTVLRDNIREAIVEKLKSAGLTLAAIGAASITKLLTGLQDNSLQHESGQTLHPAPVFMNLLSARTLLQVMTSESLPDLTQRALILATVSRWLQSYFGFQPMVADSPAHFWQLLSVTQNLINHLSPVTTGQQPINFENGHLNQLFQITLDNSQAPSDPVINLTPLPSNELFAPATDYERHWQVLHKFCQEKGVQSLQLHPTSSFGVPHLYLRAWQNDKAGQKVLTGIIHRDTSTNKRRIMWWTDHINNRNALNEGSGNPLTSDIIASLPKFISASLSGRDDRTPDCQHLQPSDVSSFDSFTAIAGNGLLLLDWQSDRNKSALPRMTLITDSAANGPVPVSQLQAIQNLQPPSDHPVISLISKAGYDLLWLYLATRFGS